MNLRKIILTIAILVAAVLPLQQDKVHACLTTNPANVSCNPSYYHASSEIKVVIKETSEVKLWLPNNGFSLKITVLEPGKQSVVLWWDQKPSTTAAWDTRTVEVPTGGSKQLTYKVEMCYAGNKNDCFAPYGWMPSNTGAQRYNCGTGCQCPGYPAGTYYAQGGYEAFVNTVTQQLNGAKFYDLHNSAYSLFNPGQRAAGSADNALTCWNDNMGGQGNQADFNDQAMLWTVKATQVATAPTVTTASPVTAIKDVTATAGGNVTSDGGSAILERGVVYSHANQTPTVTDSKVTATGTTGAFTANLTGLSVFTQYYVRAYARNAMGISYGAVVSFKTLDSVQGPPTVTTSEVSSITSISAIGGGNVTSEGGSAITARGIVYSKTNHTPTITDSKITTDGTTGAYSSNMVGLTANTKYYVRAFATNAVGTAYGAVVEFTTATGNQSAPTVVTRSPATGIESTAATVTGEVTSDGNSTITERGIVYSAIKTMPTLSDSINRNDPGKLGVFEIDITGLSPRTRYYARAYAKNAIGTSYGAVVEFTTSLSVPTHTPTDTGFSDDFLLYLGGVLYVMGISMFIGAKAVTKKRLIQVNG